MKKNKNNILHQMIKGNASTQEIAEKLGYNESYVTLLKNLHVFIDEMKDREKEEKKYKIKMQCEIEYLLDQHKTAEEIADQLNLDMQYVKNQITKIKYKKNIVDKKNLKVNLDLKDKLLANIHKQMQLTEEQKALLTKNAYKSRDELAQLLGIDRITLNFLLFLKKGY